MTRILLRAGKDPFKVASPENTLDSNLIGNNTGNLLFSTSAHKMLSVPDADIDAAGLTATRANAEEINDRYDVFVLPFANALRPSFAKHLVRYTALIEQLTIPVVVLGMGAQAGIDSRPDSLASIDDDAVAFLKAVLSRSNGPIGVRGEFTYDYIRRLGFSNVEVIGCPSMFTYGDRLHVEKRAAAIAEGARVAINGTPTGPMPNLIARHATAWPNMRFIVQDRHELDLLLWSRSLESSLQPDDYPSTSTHPLYETDRMRCLIDAWTWIDYMRTFEFAFGSRIHGNIAALLAGTPAMVLAHDSRTLELARYFEIPYRPIEQIDGETTAADLYEQADFSAMNQGHAGRFRQLLGFLDSHGLDTIYRHPYALAAYDRRVAATPFPSPVRAAVGLSTDELMGRLRWLRRRHDQKLDSLGRRVAALEQAHGSTQRSTG